MDHGHDMGSGMGGMAAPPPAMNSTDMDMTAHPHKTMMMMHMTFYWGTKAQILFFGWPGTNPGMYVLALVFVFVLSLTVEWLSHCQIIEPGTANLAAGLVQTLLHTMRVGLAYMVMLAVMSFNGGVLLAAVAGHALGFFLFGSRVFRKSPPTEETSGLLPSSC